MTVLGIHSFIHDSGACIAADGRVSAISEERLDRIKHSAAFPVLAIEYVLGESGLSDINDVDLVVYDMFEGEGAETLKGILSLGYRGRIESIRHHDAHAASAYFASPFDDAAVLVVDGAGSNGREYPRGSPEHFLSGSMDWMQEVQSFYRGSGAGLSLVHRTFATPGNALGVGFLYGVSCEYLGFDKLDGGKLMGLAPYGKKKPKFNDDTFQDMCGDLLIPFEREILLREDWVKTGRRLFPGVPRRKPGGAMLQGHMYAALHVQQQAESAMLALAKHARRMTGSKNICLSGGVALNGNANTVIAENAGFEEIFIQPAANDYGIPLGCALYGFHVILGGAKRFRMKHAYLGRKYSGAEIDAAIDKFGGKITSRKTSSWSREAALAISKGKILGFFSGASEFGPRALGNRSILADPRRKDIKDILNSRVKFREPFRPYAPAALEEFADDYFVTRGPSPYMLLIVNARKEKKKLIPGVLHIDGTARLQTVTKKYSPELYSVVEKFHDATGVPMLLNTSMNVSGEPIVETPEDAIRCLLGTGLDALVMCGRIIEKTA